MIIEDDLEIIETKKKISNGKREREKEKEKVTEISSEENGEDDLDSNRLNDLETNKRQKIQSFIRKISGDVEMLDEKEFEAQNSNKSYSSHLDMLNLKKSTLQVKFSHHFSFSNSYNDSKFFLMPIHRKSIIFLTSLIILFEEILQIQFQKIL